MGFLDQIPSSVLAAFAGIGALYAGSKIISYVRLLLSLFVLSGKNVCLFAISAELG
jgi:17beta-estradiol 17-dehydrogenase / very-long-chain 3-oxoacyl-CoA reductase